jgi:hypothetical protein
VEDAIWIRIIQEIRQKTQALTFNLISGFYLIVGFKPDIRAGSMKKRRTAHHNSVNQGRGNAN